MRTQLKIVFSALCALLVFASSALAQQGGQSKGPAVSTGRYEVYMSAFYMGLSRGATTLALGPGFNLVLFPKIPWLQVGGEVTYQKMSASESSTTNMLILAGVTANLGGATLNESYFASLGVAIKSGSGDAVETTTTDEESPNGFGFSFITGKRFPLGGGWCMRPSVGVVVAGSSALLIRPFAVSYHF